jgi:hypothetical protein
MHEKELPRPFGVGVTCTLTLLVAVWAVTEGMIEINTDYYTEGAGWTFAQVFLGPAISIPTALIMLRGKNWARWVFWLVYGPVGIWLVTLDPKPTHCIRIAVYVLGSVLLMLPAAQSYFSGQDFRRRARAARRERPLMQVPKDAPGKPRDYRY